MIANSACEREQSPVRADSIPRSVDRSNLTLLPPAGASPAGDLQRRLSESALLGFYRDDRSLGWLPRSNLFVMAGAGIVSWIAVFGMGWLLTG